MIVLAETSFLCATHRQQDNSARAYAWLAAHGAPVLITTLVRYEFEQGVRFQTWLHRHDHTKGYALREGTTMLAKLKENISLGIFVSMPVDWTAVHERARRLAATHTPQSGARGFDLLHVASALELKADLLLSLDASQRHVATDEHLSVAPDLD